MFGFSTARQVIAWIQSRLRMPNPFVDMSQSGIDWLEKLSIQPDVIQNVLDQLIREAQAMLSKEIKEYFKPFCRIPIETITFYTYLDQDIVGVICKIKTGILFIQKPTMSEDERVADKEEKETRRKFEALTASVLRFDPKGKLSLIILDWEAYFDLIGLFESKNTHELFMEENPSDIQILWISDGKGLHVVRHDLTNLRLIEDYTEELSKLSRL